jgi:predicted glycosyltransferase
MVGSGHLRAVSHLARSLCEAGLDVLIVTSTCQGDALHFDYGSAAIESLPALKRHHTARSFIMESEDARFDGKSFRGLRGTRLLEIYERSRPDAIVIETWPIARHNFHDELLCLLRHVMSVSPRPRIYCLARDVVYMRDAMPSPHRTMESDFLNQFFDSVIVRGDGQIAFSESYPAISHVQRPVRYAGYFIGALPPRSTQDFSEREVIVAAGSGFSQSTRDWYASALNAWKHSGLRRHRWRFLVPAPFTTQDFEALRELALKVAGDSIVVQRNEGAFPARLVNAAAAILQAGYNTTLEAIASGIPTVLLPMSTAYEQTYRLERLSQLGIIGSETNVIPCTSLDTSKLAQCLDSALRGHPAPSALNLDGARRAASWIADDVRTASSRHHPSAGHQGQLRARPDTEKLDFIGRR